MGAQRDFDPPGEAEILEIIGILDESEFDALHLEMGGFRLVLGNAPGTGPPELPVPPPALPPENSLPAPPSPPAGEEAVRPGAATKPDSGEASQAPEAGAPGEAGHQEGLVPIRAPLLGIFYRAPDPGAPPFVEMGGEVRVDDTVCLIEVMKLFNSVKSEVAGRVARVCAENGKMVEQGQTLFLVQPAQSKTGGKTGKNQ